MKLKLIRPIVFFDLETTGVDTQLDRIVEMAFVKLMPDGTIQTKSWRVNPDRDIPAESTAIHGIKNEDVATCLFFRELAHQVHEFIDGCDLGGFNLLIFDVPVLFFEFRRAGITWKHQDCHVVDVGNIFKIQEARTLSAAVKFYCDRDHSSAHSAVADTNATIDVLIRQLSRYEGLPLEVAELAQYSNYNRKRADVTGKFVRDETGQYLFNFGPYKGQPALSNIDYLYWMMSKDFPEDAEAICEELTGQRVNSEEFWFGRGDDDDDEEEDTTL